MIPIIRGFECDECIRLIEESETVMGQSNDERVALNVITWRIYFDNTAPMSVRHTHSIIEAELYFI